MNKHPHVYKTFVRAVVLRTLCFALLLGSFALTAKAGPTTSPSFSPPSTISGKVTDSKNAPLEGASITIKGTKRGTTTNATGAFTLQNVPDNAVLVISFSGYKTQELPVKGRTSYNVALETDISNLSDVVVYIGYGTTTKKDATGAISQVKATQLENENPRSVQDILRGNAPGLDVSFDASTKGSSASLLVRGKGSLKASNSPLIVLNGSIFGGQLADLNPNDIATIDVLKDASASAIYGARRHQTV